ncbi:tetraspanin-16-like [Salminus brasiliensis]|uniref:tetraspanin-16-like n=1 Tax=Salminus brasiliensis TaxID=930266 RepID=UPI003B83127F
MDSLYHRDHMRMKYLLIGFCTLMFICGCLLLSVGSWIIYGAKTLVYALGSYSMQIKISYAFIGMGDVLILISIIGCYGAWKENRHCLLLFFFILTVVFVAEVMGTIFVLIYKELVGMVLRQASKQTLQKLYMGPAAADPISTAWNTVMITFKCCGFENSTLDFKDSAFSKTTGLNYPKTCCVNKTSPACDGINIVPNLIYPESCYEKMIAVIKEKSAVLGATAGSICIIELSTMILTIIFLTRMMQ